MDNIDRTQKNLIIILSFVALLLFVGLAAMLAIRFERNPTSGVIELAKLNSPAGGAGSLAFSPNGRWLAKTSASYDTGITMWDVAHRIKIETPSKCLCSKIAFSPDGTLIAVGQSYNTIALLNPISMQQVRTMEASGQWVSDIAFSTDGKMLMAWGYQQASAHDATEGFITVWNVANGERTHVVNTRYQFIKDAVFSPDGTQIAIASLYEQEVELWDITSEKTVLILTLSLGASGSVNSVAFSPDGKLLATGDSMGNVILWNVGNGQQVRVLNSGADWINNVEFSPDGALLASGNGESSFTLWSTTNSEEIGKFPLFKDDEEIGEFPVYDKVENLVAFSPDGRLLASASSNGTV